MKSTLLFQSVIASVIVFFSSHALSIDAKTEQSKVVTKKVIQKNNANLLFKHDNKQTDAAWAGNMERNIRRYFTQHALADSIKLFDVDCASEGCEIRLSYKNREKARPMLENINLEKWWVFGPSSNTKGLYFYMLALDEGKASKV